MANRVVEAAGGITYRWVHRAAPAEERPAGHGDDHAPDARRHQISTATRDALAHLELCMVHRPKYDDWSWPKGKLELHETHRHAAVREIGEETGLAVALGPTIGEVEYRLLAEGTRNRHSSKGKGTAKHVQYWMATIVNPSDPQARSNALGPVFPADSGEIDQIAWVSVRQARRQLSHPQDREILDQFVDRVEEGALHGGTIIIVRHGKAMARKLWNGTDSNRPITPKGAASAYALNRELACYEPAHLISSPWIRCKETLQGFSWLTDLPLIIAPELTEDAFAANPDSAWHVIRDEIARVTTSGTTSAICMHRPVIGGVFSHLRRLCPSKSLSRQLAGSSPYMPTGCAIALFIVPGPDGPAVIDIQRVTPLVY